MEDEYQNLEVVNKICFGFPKSDSENKNSLESFEIMNESAQSRSVSRHYVYSRGIRFADCKHNTYQAES